MIYSVTYKGIVKMWTAHQECLPDKETWKGMLASGYELVKSADVKPSAKGEGVK